MNARAAHKTWVTDVSPPAIPKLDDQLAAGSTRPAAVMKHSFRQIIQRTERIQVSRSFFVERLAQITNNSHSPNAPLPRACRRG